jgi:hypothetical protein
MRMPILINKQFATLEAHTPHHLHQQLEELSVVYGACKHKVSKVAGTLVVVLTTAATYFAVFQYTHARVKEAAELTLGRGWRGYLTDGTTDDLLRTEDTKLDAHNGLSFGRMRKEWHVSM